MRALILNVRVQIDAYGYSWCAPQDDLNNLYNIQRLKKKKKQTNRYHSDRWEISITFNACLPYSRLSLNRDISFERNKLKRPNFAFPRRLPGAKFRCSKTWATFCTSESKTTKTEGRGKTNESSIKQRSRSAKAVTDCILTRSIFGPAWRESTIFFLQIFVVHRAWTAKRSLRTRTNISVSRVSFVFLFFSYFFFFFFDIEQPKRRFFFETRVFRSTFSFLCPRASTSQTRSVRRKKA